MLTTFLSKIATAATASGHFASVTTKDNSVVCNATASAAPSTYRVQVAGEEIIVGLYMADRWLSHSIEADLLNTGDKLEDLISEELAELGYKEQHPGESVRPCEHFRNDDRLFTFQTKIPVSLKAPDAAERATLWLLAYEDAFARLGDMSAADEAE